MSTKLYLDLSSGTYFTEQPIIVEILDDDDLEAFCNMGDTSRSAIGYSLIDTQRTREPVELYSVRLFKAKKR